jgi:hypothetical protein
MVYVLLIQVVRCRNGACSTSLGLYSPCGVWFGTASRLKLLTFIQFLKVRGDFWWNTIFGHVNLEYELSVVCQKLIPGVFDNGSIFLGPGVSVHAVYKNLNSSEVPCEFCGR